MGHDMNELRTNPALIDEHPLQRLSMDDELGRTPITKIHDRLWSLLRGRVAGVVPRVVDGQNQREPSQEWKETVEPQVTLLKVNHIRIECLDASDEVPAGAKLADRLSQARLVETLNAHSGIEGRDPRPASGHYCD